MPPKSKDDTLRDFDALFKVVSPEPAPLKLQAPTIIVQPASRDTVPCHAVGFWIDVEGTSPLTFQWRKNGKPFQNEVKEGVAAGEIIAASSYYDHTALDVTENGTVFDVIVSNSVGSVTSEAATLIVHAEPSKTDQENICAMLQVPTQVRKKIEAKEKRFRNGTVNEDDLYEDAKVHFQDFAFSSEHARGASAHSGLQEWSNEIHPSGLARDKKIHYHKGPGHGVNSDGDLADEDRMRLFSGLSKGTGISVRDIESDPAQGPRPETPLWFLNEGCLDEFLWRIANRKTKPKDRFNENTDIHPVGRKALVEAAGLDYLILRDFYLLRREDREIFERYEAEFQREKGRKRHTSSEDAVKQRRLRLVKAGNACYLPPKVNP